jgi:hypothetical protein
MTVSNPRRLDAIAMSDWRASTGSRETKALHRVACWLLVVLPHKPMSTDSRDFRTITRNLKAGQVVVDRIFDEVFPVSVRRLSNLYWTPVDVAVRATTLLCDIDGGGSASSDGADAERGELAILDIGAGVGKFCLVAAALLSAANKPVFPTGAKAVRIHGVEHRRRLVTIARNAARAMGLNVSIAAETTDDFFRRQDPRSFGGIYLFNPFAENLSTRSEHLDESVELGESRFWRDVEATQRFLRDARIGTRVVTYCGWGGELPSDYELVASEWHGGTLDLWIKRPHSSVRRPAMLDDDSRRRMRLTIAAAGVTTASWDDLRELPDSSDSSE